VREHATQEVVGTYRLLSPGGAREAGRLYSDAEFDLAHLSGIRGELVEAGRSCVHPEHRSGAVIALLWSAIADYMVERGHRYLAGCASVSLADGGRAAAGIHARLAGTHAGPGEWRVFPRLALPLASLEADPQPKLPPLIKGYLRAGARVCGAPAWDPDFGTADFFMLLALDNLDARYAARFFPEAAVPA
jgi:putative hemolysin